MRVRSEVGTSGLRAGQLGGVLGGGLGLLVGLAEECFFGGIIEDVSIDSGGSF